MKIIAQSKAEENIKEICNVNNYTLIENFIYKNASKTRIKLLCNNDNYTWITSYKHLIYSNSKCPKCSGVAKINQIDGLKKIEMICNEKGYELQNKKIIICNNTVKLNLLCRKCNKLWDINYNNLMRGHGCPNCVIKNSKKIKMLTKDMVLKTIKNICQEKNYTLTNDFTYIGNSKTKIELRCNVCNTIWRSTYANFVVNKYGCPQCTPKKIRENKLLKYGENWMKFTPSFNNISIKYIDMISEKIKLPIRHALNHINGEKKFKIYSVDGFIENNNIVIEWDERWHNSKKQKEVDLIRENFLKEKYGCKIIRINQDKFLLNIKTGIDMTIKLINNIIINDNK